MKSFKDRLNDLIDKNEKLGEIVANLNISSTLLYQWRKGFQNPNLKNLIILANYFECTLDYLLGRTEDNSVYKIKQTKDFETQLKAVVKEKGKTLYRLKVDGIISKGNTYDWFHDKSSPSMDKILKLADYLQVSVDHLVGRE